MANPTKRRDSISSHKDTRALTNCGRKRKNLSSEKRSKTPRQTFPQNNKDSFKSPEIPHLTAEALKMSAKPMGVRTASTNRFVHLRRMFFPFPTRKPQAMLAAFGFFIHLFYSPLYRKFHNQVFDRVNQAYKC